MTFAEAKLLIDCKVKTAMGIDSPFTEGEIMSGMLKYLTYTGKYDKGGEKASNIIYHVDISDPITGGIHHVISYNCYPENIKESTIEEVRKAERRAYLESELAKLG